MVEHASDLVLDELASGVAAAPVQAEHVRGCPRCTGRLESFAAERRSSLAAPGYASTLAALRARPARQPFWRRWTFVLPLAASLAAGVFLVLPRPTDRIKGRPSLELLREGAGGRVTGPVRPGERLAIAVGAAGAKELLVMAVGDDGSIAKLWPTDHDGSGPAPAGAAALLSPAFVVTPGSATLYAFFSATPLVEKRVEAALGEAVRRARQGGRTPVEASIDPLPGESARVQLQLCVEGSPCSLPR
jgi:hypothetical protein